LAPDRTKAKGGGGQVGISQCKYKDVYDNDYAHLKWGFKKNVDKSIELIMGLKYS
jgi:hypothetical protein